MGTRERNLFPVRNKLTILWANGEEETHIAYDDFDYIKKIKQNRCKGMTKKEIKNVVFSDGYIEVLDNPPIDDETFERMRFSNEPLWIEEDTTVWGEGYRGGIFVATPDFKEVIRLKK